MIYIDTDDDRDAEMSIRLTGLYDLSADDFILQDAMVGFEKVLSDKA